MAVCVSECRTARQCTYLTELVITRLGEFGNMIFLGEFLVNDETKVPHGCKFSQGWM